MYPDGHAKGFLFVVLYLWSEHWAGVAVIAITSGMPSTWSMVPKERGGGGGVEPYRAVDGWSRPAVIKE